jgi:hypothetical protein
VAHIFGADSGKVLHVRHFGEEFYKKFLVGYDATGRQRSLNIYLTPTIEEPGPRPKSSQ